MHSINELRDIVDREIEKMDFSERLPSELYQPVDYIMSNGGKRLRPVLALMACQLFTDDISECIRPAMAIELFHNFTLLHDDIMDRADVRRGMPAVHKKWNENTAILSGDAMVVLSFDQICSAKTEILPRLVSVFNKTAIEVCEGQQLDMNFETASRVDEADYLEMIKLKTSVLIAAAMEIGAITSGASKKDSGLLYESGLNLGIAFQLQDDLLDLYGNHQEFGKKSGGDIIMNKKTILLIKALEKANGDTAERIRHIMQNEKNPEIKIQEIKKIFDSLGIEALTKKMADNYFKIAITKLEGTSCQKERKQEFTAIINSLMDRKY